MAVELIKGLFFSQNIQSTSATRKTEEKPNVGNILAGNTKETTSSVGKYEDDDDEIEEYRIVGSKEADPSNNKISNESPIALAIMNSKVGEVKKVASPNGEYEVEIVEIC